MGLDGAIGKCNDCLDERESIPGAPLWHMGKVAIAKSAESLALLQNTVDYLSEKAKLGRGFTADEGEFMRELFEALWWGGMAKGYAEAAALADHYVNGQGRPLRIPAEVYTSSVIVRDTTAAMKAHIRTLSSTHKPIAHLKSGAASFLQSTGAGALVRGRRNPKTQGYLNTNGTLLAEQDNARLKNADHRFFLQAKSSKKPGSGGFNTAWRVDSVYDFEPFEKADYVTEIPLAEGMMLRLPDGLSHYLTVVGVAKAFSYFADWREDWT